MNQQTVVQLGGVQVLTELINDEEDDELSNKAYEVILLFIDCLYSAWNVLEA